MAMYFEAMAIAAELRDFPGGPKALAASIYPTVEGMRILRWPADRLDTLGGYLTYHNVTLFTYFLALFAILQGARLVRHLEEEKLLEFYLATGISKSRFVWLRTLAYASYQLVISLALGFGTALAMFASGEPDLYGSIVTLLAGGICIFPFFALGFLVSQFVKSARTAMGATSLVATIIYIVGNLSDKYDWLAWFKYLSPFYYANLSRPIIPGYEANYLSWFFMVGVGILSISLGNYLFQKRDVGAVAIEIGQRQQNTRIETITSYTPKSLVGDMLWRGRYGILAWLLATSAFIGVFISLMSGIVDIWEQFDFLQQFSSSGFGNTPEQQYLAMVYEILPPFVVGYIIFQASKWTSDLNQGRVQLFLSSPISWLRLNRARFIATMVVCEAIIVAAILASIIGSTLQGIETYPDAVFRVFVMYNLLAVSFISLCLALVTILHGKNPTHLLSIYVGAAWLVVFMAPYLKWPEWTVRLSIFDAFGHPFVRWPEVGNFAMITLVIAVSITTIAVVTRSSSKIG